MTQQQAQQQARVALAALALGGLGVVALQALRLARSRGARLGQRGGGGGRGGPDDGDDGEGEGRLGPPASADARYELKLRGRVDRIYELHGPKPFEFNEEVVRVFDDMVSRSVPLYCEVVDLLLYWVDKYHQAGTTVLDLGCSTGTTLDVVARALKQSGRRARLVGVDNSEAMVAECRAKLAWARRAHDAVEVRLGDILETPVDGASVVVMNYTLQFVAVAARHELLRRIQRGLAPGGILFLSEKVRTDYAEFQETCTWIYEDFKQRRGYSQRYIARKKEALMNVLVPFTDQELRGALLAAGFAHVEVVAKWNNFTTLVAHKSGLSARRGVPAGKAAAPAGTPHLDAWFDSSPVYLADHLEPAQLQALCLARLQAFAAKGRALSAQTLQEYDALARDVQRIKVVSKHVEVNKPVLGIGRAEELGAEDAALWRDCAERFKPWKKGPLELFGVAIDTEWRSDWKWSRLAPHLPPMEGRAVCDLGCGNGYFMFRMLEHRPALVVGLDPNVHAWMEFQTFKRFSGVENVHLELLRGDAMDLFPGVFDVVFCLGVLYHTSDPVGMLRSIHASMRRGASLVVDCQGIPGQDPVALFPKKRYANMTGVYFLPTLAALQHWLQRASFIQQEVLFAEPLSVEEQRITEWAPVNTSLRESLDPADPTRTKEGYPAPYRFYIKAKRG